ncbi:response regulator [Erythrobacteraceae bacterium CFH 75059]|uniref:response regulator n=1 Tax=Qipengyuania thermophila TaxID=2509361 RepID=UPI0010213283|nr:response regulator [Qipengyuania thermophila]TCD05423.1 response regulator [Erythrobacteraceae bacterium CFH 75059]
MREPATLTADRRRSVAIPTVPLLFGLLLALVCSVALVWLVAGSSLVAAAFGGASLVVVIIGLIIARWQEEGEVPAVAPPDWAVTVAAIEDPGQAVAIIDRANRLTCANRRFTDWFGEDATPPHLGLSEEATKVLSGMLRLAWREGRGAAPRLANAAGDRFWDVSVERVGRSEEYLVWRFVEVLPKRLGDNLASEISGSFGTVLSRAGVEIALVSADGIVLASTPGLSERALGDRKAPASGQEFVSLLRMDERDRLFFAREGQQGSPQQLVHVPLDEPQPEHAAGHEPSPSLMLLIDSAVGIGGGLELNAQAALPQLDALLSALSLGLAMTDRDGRFIFANKAFMRATGRSGGDLPAYPSDLVIKEDKGPLADAVRRYARGAAASGDLAVRLANEPEEPVSIGLAGLRGIGEAAVLLSLSDSTEEKRLRRQVTQATKMQAVGQLAGGVAHDFNNVLTAIIGYCDLMLLRHTPGDSDYDDIQQIKANSNRAASLTRQLLAFSRQQTLRPEVLQLPDVVSEVSQLLKRLMGDRIVFSVSHDRNLGAVRADPQQLEQVIINLVVNARDAIQSRGEGSGKISLATRRVTAADVQRMGIDMLPRHDFTALVVRDTGGGVPPRHLNKIFEPFFTTKEQGKGTGLGLSTVYGIVKQSNGWIFCENITGPDGEPTGACFTIYLPVYDGPDAVRPPKEREGEEEASAWAGGGRLLLVEDEDMVRAVAERALTRAGYIVTTCSDGEEGLAAVAKGGEFDLVLSDVVMPGLDGPAMARAIRKVRPHLPILFMSGYAEEQLRRDIDIEDMHFIPKPFSVQQISTKVAAVLKAHRTVVTHEGHEA